MDDLISRQAAIEAVKEKIEYNIETRPSWIDSIPEILEQMPSALVRCKECKWWDQKDDSPYGYCHAMKHAYYSKHWEIGIYRTYKDNWFCADGERREDDPNT